MCGCTFSRLRKTPVLSMTMSTTEVTPGQLAGFALDKRFDWTSVNQSSWPSPTSTVSSVNAVR
jgi:hypothetical protein